MDYKIVQRQRVFDGFYKMDEFVVQHEKFAGGWGPNITRELMVRPDAVVVLLFDPKTSNVVLVEQFRVGGLKEPNPWLMEMVAGLIDKDESPEEVGRREAVEEAGAELGRMELICEYLPSPGGSDERVYLYVAEVESQGLGGIHGLDEEGEDIKVHVMPFEEAWRLVQTGRINNAAGIIAMQWLKMNQDRLRQEWLK